MGKRVSPRIVHRFIPCKNNCFLCKFSCGNAFTVVAFKLSCRFSPARFFFLHGFRDRLLEVRRVSFVRYSLWHKNHPICQTVYHMSDKWGAVHTNVIPKLWVKTRPQRRSGFAQRKGFGLSVQPTKPLIRAQISAAQCAMISKAHAVASSCPCRLVGHSRAPDSIFFQIRSHHPTFRLCLYIFRKDIPAAARTGGRRS